MARPLSPSERRRRSERRRAILIGTVSIVVLGGIVGTYVVSESQRIDLRKSDLCPKNNSPTAEYAFLIDLTDSANDIQAASIRREFAAAHRSVPEYGRLSLYAIRPEIGISVEPILSRCNPGDGEGASTWNKNPELIRKRWEIEFQEPMASVIEELLSAPVATSSPILEQLQGLSLSAFESEDVQDKRLFIISDLLQHSEVLSHYHKTPQFEDFRSTAGYRRVRCRLDGVSVLIHYIRRDTAPQGRSHIRFWDQYFKASGADVEEVDWITG